MLFLSKEKFHETAQRHGFTLSGWAPMTRPVTFEFYRQWIEQGLHGDMDYLSQHLPAKESPQKKYPLARTCLTLAAPYVPHPRGQRQKLSTARVALYAQGEDYHFWLKENLNGVIQELKEFLPDHHFECHTDSAPLLERDFAVRAGMGWSGKNTCVIHPKKGSLFLLGEILTSWQPGGELSPLPDFCGTCSRCIEICPTGALVEPHKLDARKCLSYWSIESREVPPVQIREKWGDWFFGCDLCQTVCPWNEKVFGKSNLQTALMIDHSTNEEAALIEELRWILSASGKKIERTFRGTALMRAGPFGLRRNALIVIGNRKITALQPEVANWVNHEKLGELALWAQSKL